MRNVPKRQGKLALWHHPIFHSIMTSKRLFNNSASIGQRPINLQYATIVESNLGGLDLKNLNISFSIIKALQYHPKVVYI